MCVELFLARSETHNKREFESWVAVRLLTCRIFVAERSSVVPIVLRRVEDLLATTGAPRYPAFPSCIVATSAMSSNLLDPLGAVMFRSC